MPGPLDGVRIIDLSAVIAGPMATGLLADQGAEVIKVEPLGLGDLCRWLGPNRNGLGAMFAAVNRNKRSIALNLKDEKGKAILRDLLTGADVFVQNFRPGAIARMGFGYEALKETHPGLIYVSMSGFGEDGPYAKRRVYDPVVQAMSGFADSQADAKTGEPKLIQTIACDKVTALTAAQAITAALFAKAKNGQGQYLSLNMIDATLAFLWPDAFYNHALLDSAAPPSPDFSSFYGIMATRDGHITLITISDDEFGDCCRALNRPDIAADPRFKDIFGRMANASALKAAFAEAVATFTTAEVKARLEAEDVPHAVVLTRDEVETDPQIVHNGTLIETLRVLADCDMNVQAAARKLGRHPNTVVARLARIRDLTGLDPQRYHALTEMLLAASCWKI